MVYTKWYKSDKTEQDQVISSRVRLARNLEQHPFQRKLTESDAKEIVQKVQNRIETINQTDIYSEFFAHDLCKIERQMFLEKHIVSPKFLLGRLPKAIYTDKEQSISIMVNEEDHVRIQAVKPGRDIFVALSDANQVDDMLERSLNFSFDGTLGYLTSCPTNVGTGLRASFLIHLPCLDKTELLKKIIPYITKKGLTLRGIYGEGTIPLGSIYQLSNQVTTGKSEKEILKDLEIATDTIIQYENQVMDKILSTRQNYLQDKAYRAYAILASCRRISVKEAMGLLSDVRLGFLAKLLDMPKPDMPMYEIMINVQPGHLCYDFGVIMDEGETDIARADYLRTVFSL